MTRAVDVAGRELPPNTALGTRNLIINGDMRIDQRGTSTEITQPGTSSYYTVDRWQILTQSASSFSWQQVDDAPIGYGFEKSMKVTATNTVAPSTQTNRFRQKIEGYNVAHLDFGKSSAKTITISFWVKSSLTGTFAFSLGDTAVGFSYVTSYTISSANTWEKKTITIAGPTSGGTWPTTNGIGLWCIWDLGTAGTQITTTLNEWHAGTSQSSFTEAVSLCGNQNATWQITGVQLEVGEEATEFEHRPYDMELARCQRYFQKFDGVNCIDGQFYSSTVARFHVQLNPSMRTAPTGTWDGTLTASVEEVGVAFRDPTAYSVNGGSTNSYTFNATGMSGATPSKQAMFRGNLIALSLSAEL